MSSLVGSLTVAELRELVRGVLREELARKKHRKLPPAPTEQASEEAIDKVRRRLRRQGVVA